MTVTGVTFGNEMLKDLSLKGWTFSNVIFKGPNLDSITFENTVFNDVIFLNAMMKRCRFINCIFTRCTIASGSWIENSFIGGSMNDIWFAEKEWPSAAHEYWYPWVEWEKNNFESIRLEKLTIPERTGIWKQCRFSNTKLINNNFAHTGLRKMVFRNCEFRGNEWGGFAAEGMTDCVIEDCRFNGNTIRDGFGGRVERTEFNEPGGISLGGSVKDSTFVSSKGVSIENAETVVIHGPQGYVIVGGGRNIKIGAIRKDLVLRGDCSSVSVESLIGGNVEFYNGNYRNCSFENAVIDTLSFNDNKFYRCIFRNIIVRKRMYIKGSPDFSECTIEKFRRNPDVKAYEYSDQPPIEYLFPWETAPGVNKE